MPPAAAGGLLQRSPPEVVAAVFAGVALAFLYSETAAPGVTWWDAGEFIAAAHTLGIPHPPGTPLYVLLANVWAKMLAFLEPARAVNLLSAACTALAASLSAAYLARATRSTGIAIAGALCAGTMSTVWLIATEAEVYGVSLLLAMLSLWSGERAGRTGDARAVALTAYLFALAAPLHVTALVAAPAAVLLAATRPDLTFRWRTGAVLMSALLVSAGIGTGRWWLGAVAGAVLVILGIIPRLPRRDIALVPVVVVVGLSALAFLLVRAQHDPGINQGNPATFTALLSVISRDQYNVAGLFPRQAPIWLQLVNVLEYADWQVALGLAPGVTPTGPRTALSLAYIVLGVVGAVMHRRANARSWRGLALLGLCGSLGVVAYLNLRAGPSIGHGILPEGTSHEPRERDYFFMFAFWTWGLWAGIGAAHAATRMARLPPRMSIALGLVVAALPAALNWRAVHRDAGWEATLPGIFAEELLRDAPDSAVLVVAGDNDTYPLWFRQQVLERNRDVVVVTYPLLGADWYRAELHRRWGLGTPPPHRWRGISLELEALRTSTRARGRPVVVASTVDRAVRDRLGDRWIMRGLVYVAVEEDNPLGESINVARVGAGSTGQLPAVDFHYAERWGDALASLVDAPLRESTDPTNRLMLASLRCRSLPLRARTDTAAVRLLDSTCNYR